MDNSTHCFGFQVDNGIPIVSFTTNKNDRELVHVLHFLKTLVDVEDVRPVLAETFRLSQLRIPRILNKVDGVIEYCVEDISDESVLWDLPKRVSMSIRKSRAE